jgi:hypothetical protein
MNNSQVQKNFVTEAPVKRNDIKLTVTVGLPDGHNMAYQIESSGQKSDPRRLTVRYKNLRSMLDELIVLYNVVNKAQSSLDVKFDYLKFKLHLEARQESWLLSQKEDLGKLIEDKTLFFGQLTNMCQVQIIFEIIKLLKEQSWPVPPKLPSLIRKFIQLINQNCDPESHETELDNIVRMSESLIKEIENPPLPEKVEQLLFDSQDPKSIQENTIHSFFDNSQNNYMNYDSVDGQNIEGSLGLYSDRGQQQPIPKSAFVRPNRTYSTPPKHQSSNPFDNPDPRAHSTSRTPFDDPSPPRGVNHNPFSPPREAHTPTNSLNYPQKIEVSNNPFENNSPRDNLTKSLQDPMAPWYNTSADLTSVNITSNTSASNFNPQIGNNPYIDISRGAPQWPNGYVVIPDTTSPYNSTHFQKTSNLHQDHPGDRTGPTPNFTPNSSNHAFKPAPVQFNPYLQTNTNSSNTARNPYSDPRPTQPAQKKPEEPLRNQPIINNPFANQTPLPEVVVQRKPEPQPQPRPEPQPQPRPEPQPQPNQGPSKPVPRPQPAPVTPTPSITSPTEPNSKLITANPVPSQKPVNPPTNTQNPNKPENSKQLFISKTTQKENIAKSNLEKKEDGPSNTSKPTKYIDAFKQNDRMLHKLPNNLEQENCWKFRKWLYLRNEESKWLDMLVSESITNKHTNYKILDFLFRFNTSNIHDKETDNRRLGKSELIETYKKILEQIKMKGASYDPYNLTMIASQLGDACPDTKVYFSTEFIELIKSNVYKIQEAAYDKYIEMYVSNPDSMIPLFILYTLATQNYTTFREKIGTSALPGLKDSKAVLVRKVLGLFEHLKDHFQTEQVFEKHLITVTNLLSLEAKKDKRVTLLKSEDASTNILSYIEQYQDKSQFKGVHIKFIAYASAYSYPRSINELKVMFDALRNDFKVKLLDERENKREDYGLFWSVLKDKISFESNKDFPEEIVNHLNLTWNLSKDSKDTYESSKSISERIDELMAEGKDHEFAGLPAFLIKQESNRSNEMGIILKQYRDAITNWYAKDILEMKITKSRAKNLQSTILKDSKGKLEENLKFWCDAFKIDVLKNTKEGPSLFGQKWSLCCHLLSDSDAIDKAAASIETFGVKLELLKCPMNKHDPELSSYNLFSILQKDCPGLFKMANLKGSKTIEKFIHDQFENPGMNMNLLKKNIDEFSAKWAENIKEWSTNQVNDSTIKEMENLSGFNEHLLMEIGAFFGFMRDKDQDLIQTVQDTCLMYKSLLNFEEFQRDFSLLDEFISNQKDPQKYIRFSKEDFAQLKKVSEVVIREKKLMVNYKELTEGGKKALILFSKERRLFDLIVPCLDLIKHFLKIRDRTVHMSMLKEKTEANVTKDGISDLIRLINYWERARTSSKPHEPYTAHRVMSSIREFYSNDLKDLKSSKSRPLDLVLIKKSGEALITASKILQTENMEAELDGILSKGTYILEPKDSQKTGHSYALRFELTDGDKKIEVSHKKLEEFERIISGQSNQGHESESKFNQENGEAFLEIYGTLNKAKRLLERLRSTGNILNLTKAIDKAKQETKITQIEVKQSEYLTTSKGRGTEYINLDEKEFRQFSSKIKVEKVSVKIDFEMNKRVRRGGDKNERKEEATASFPFHILCELLSHIEQANKVNNTREVSDKQVYWITYLEGRQKEFLANYTFMFLKSLPQKPKIQAEFEEEFTEIIEKRTFPEKPQPDQKGEIQKIKLVDRPTEYLLDYYDESQDIKADAILKFVRKDLLAHTFKNRLREHSVRLEDIDDSFSNNILKEVSFAIYEGEDIKRNNRVNEIMTTRKFYYYTYDNEREENGDRNLRLEVFFNCVEKTETDYTQLRPYNILLLNQESTMIEICTFLERAFYDSSGYWYFILDFHLLSAEIRAEFISFLRSMVKNDYQNYGSKRSNFHLLLLIDRHALKGSIADEIERKAQDILMYPRHWDIQNRKSDSVVNLLKGVPITLVTSDMAGLGKTHYIRKKAKGKLLRLFLSGDITEKNIVKRLGRLASTIQAEDESVFSLHVKMDMMENMMKNCERLDQLLFRILFLKYSPFGDSYLFFDKVDHFYVEISNNYKDFLLKELTIFSIFKDFQSKVVNIKGISFSTQMQEEGHPPIDLDDLQGPKDQNNQSENRIFYICRAHQLLQDNKIQTEELFLSPEYRHPEYSAQVKEDWLRTLHKIFLGNNRQGGNMTQFVSLIKNLYDDLKELNKIAAISLEVIRIETEGRAIKKDIDSILKVRSTLLKLVFESNVELVWSTVDFIRTENKMTKEFRDCGDKVTKDKLRTELKQLLDRYQNDIEHLPNFKSWEKGKKVMSFLRNGGVKLLSRDLSHIDPEVHEFFKIASGGIPIHDLQKFEIDEKEARARLEREGPQMNEKASHLIRVEYTRPFSKEKLVWTAENFQKFIIDELINFFEIRTSNHILEEDIRNFGNKKGYTFTCDNYIKILMILKRVNSKLPVVISGATGCGKSYLIEFIAKCLFKATDKFCLMTLHSGVTEQELEDFLIESIKQPEEK